MVIIVEGGELVGKTSVVRALQDTIPYHTLIKLSGVPTGLYQDHRIRGSHMRRQYESLMDITEYLHNDKHRTLIFDRHCTTEKVMFPASFNAGGLHRFERHLASLNAMQFILVAPIAVLRERYELRLQSNPQEKQSFANIVDINDKYLREAATSQIKTVTVVNDGSRTPSELAEHIISIAKIQLHEVYD